MTRADAELPLYLQRHFTASTLDLCGIQKRPC
jgi:hypothetical protein